MIAKVWPKGENSGDPSKLQEVKNPYVIPYPVAEDDDRICFYLSKERLSDAEKAKRRYYVINIDDLFDNGQYRKTDIKVTNDKICTLVSTNTIGCRKIHIVAICNVRQVMCSLCVWLKYI